MLKELSTRVDSIKSNVAERTINSKPVKIATLVFAAGLAIASLTDIGTVAVKNRRRTSMQQMETKRTKKE